MRFLIELLKMLLVASKQANGFHTYDSLAHMMLEQQIQQQMQQDAEIGRLAATGVEFGGFSSDPCLNPGMMSTMMDSNIF